MHAVRPPSTGIDEFWLVSDPNHIEVVYTLYLMPLFVAILIVKMLIKSHFESKLVFIMSRTESNRDFINLVV